MKSSFQTELSLWVLERSSGYHCTQWLKQGFVEPLEFYWLYLYIQRCCVCSIQNKQNQTKNKPPSCYYSLLTNGISFSQIFFLSNQNADLKKQLHELQAKITALSEKQVGKQRRIFNTLFQRLHFSQLPRELLNF